MRNRTRWNVGALALVAGLGLGVVAPASAQEPTQPPREGHRMEHRRPDPQQMIEHRVKMLTERLNLTPDQAARAREIFTKEAEQRKAIFEQAGIEPGKPRGGRDGQPPAMRQGDDPRRDAFRSEMRKLHEQTEKEFVSILDKQQKDKFEGMKKERKERGPRGKAPRGRK